MSVLLSCRYKRVRNIIIMWHTACGKVVHDACIGDVMWFTGFSAAMLDCSCAQLLSVVMEYAQNVCAECTLRLLLCTAASWPARICAECARAAVLLSLQRESSCAVACPLWAQETAFKDTWPRCGLQVVYFHVRSSLGLSLDSWWHAVCCALKSKWISKAWGSVWCSESCRNLYPGSGHWGSQFHKENHL